MFGKYEIHFQIHFPFKTESCWLPGPDLRWFEKPYFQRYKLPPLPLEHLEPEDLEEYIPEGYVDEYDSSSDSDIDYLS